eukprot:s9534_g1.t1
MEAADQLHNLWIGCAKDSLASVFCDIIEYHPMFRGSESWDEALAQLCTLLHDYCDRSGLEKAVIDEISLTKLSIKSITYDFPAAFSKGWANRVGTAFALEKAVIDEISLTKLSIKSITYDFPAAFSKGWANRVGTAFAADFLKNTDVEELKVHSVLTWAITEYAWILEQAEMWLTDEQALQAASAGNLYLEAHVYLARKALLQGRPRFKVRPRLHSFACETVAKLENGSRMNPKYCATWSDESYIGQVCSIGKSTATEPDELPPEDPQDENISEAGSDVTNLEDLEAELGPSAPESVRPRVPMAGLESVPAFTERAKQIGISEELLKKNLDTYGKLAFICSSRPSSGDDKALFDSINESKNLPVPRRALAFDQLGLASFTTMESWHNKMFQALLDAPPAGYRYTTVQQILAADQKLWQVVAQDSRGDISIGDKGENSKGGKNGKGKSKGGKSNQSKADASPNTSLKELLDSLPEGCVRATDEGRFICPFYNKGLCRFQKRKSCRFGKHVCNFKGCGAERPYIECRH